MAEETPRRRWFQFSLRALLVAIGIVAVLTAVVVWTQKYTSDPVIPDPWKGITSIRVTLSDDPHNSDFALTITGPKQIKALVADPLRKSQHDPHPAKYVVLGYAMIYYDDGTEDWVLLFHPWGRCKHGDRYLIADFSALRDEFERLNETAPSPGARANLFRHK